MLRMFSKSHTWRLLLLTIVILVFPVTYKLLLIVNSIGDMKTQINNCSSGHNKENTRNELALICNGASSSTEKPSTNTTKLTTDAVETTAILFTTDFQTVKSLTNIAELTTENKGPLSTVSDNTVELHTYTEVPCCSDTTLLYTKHNSASETNTVTIDYTTSSNRKVSDISIAHSRSSTKLSTLNNDDTVPVVVHSITTKGILTTQSVESTMLEISSTTVGSELTSVQISPNETKIINEYLKNVIRKTTWSSVTSKNCSVPLQLPINKIYVSETFTYNCFNYFSCKTVIVQKQKLDILTTNDIQYNFIIGGSGDIFEGMCWSCKLWSKHVDSTSILVAMIGTSYDYVSADYSDYQLKSNKINSKQYASLDLLIKANRLTGNISSEYQLLPYSCVGPDKNNPSDEVTRNLEIFEHFYPHCTSK